MEDQRIKQCRCGEGYTRTQWDALDRRPDWPVPDGRPLQLRNCVCGSTLSLKEKALAKDEGVALVPSAEVSGTQLAPPTFEELIERGPRSSRSPSRLSASPFPMFLFDRDTGSILDANEAAVRATGWSRDGLLGAIVSDIFPPKGPDGPTHVRLRHWDTLWTGPWIMRRRDGSTFFAEVGMIEAGNEEHPSTMVLVVTPQNPVFGAIGGARASGE